MSSGHVSSFILIRLQKYRLKRSWSVCINDSEYNCFKSPLNGLQFSNIPSLFYQALRKAECAVSGQTISVIFFILF